jgi:hypothetical protein
LGLSKLLVYNFLKYLFSPFALAISLP